ncbi:hypothetical protein [Pyxidicoccus trucidator]|uniref:hypothetical protein n=1 Tax=Pyxidicoccus trucidator TaxID=2709662 RepID=UPI0013DBA158|nr:hypothetical protein [Pyxidicoccus trucidator]
MKRCGMGLAVVAVLLPTVGCGAGSPARRGTGSYGWATDSATAACKRNPAYCATATGREVAPLAVRAAQAGAAGKAWQALDALVQKGLEDILVECARWADAEVNQQEFGGRQPTAAECEQKVGGTRENPVTRGMQLGGAKHTLALACTREKLGRAHHGRFSLEQRYRLHPETRQLERSLHETELRMLRNGGKELAGSVVPDVVIHTGDPLQVQSVYDFKFPCPEVNLARWRPYPSGSPFRDQGDAYKKILDADARLISPGRPSR